MATAVPSCRIELSVRFSNGTECRLDRIHAERWHADVPLYELMLPLMGELSFVAQCEGHGSYLVHRQPVDDVWRAIDAFERAVEVGEAVVNTADNRLVLSRRGAHVHVHNFWQLKADHTESKTYEIPWSELCGQVERIVATRAELMRLLEGHLQRMGVELWSELHDGLTVRLGVDDLWPAEDDTSRVVLRIRNESRAVVHLVNQFEHDLDRREGEATLHVSSRPNEGSSQPSIPLTPGGVYEVRLSNVKLDSVVVLRAAFSACTDPRMMMTSNMAKDHFPNTRDLSGCWQGQIEAPAVALVPRLRNWSEQIGAEGFRAWLAEPRVRADVAYRREVRAAAAVGTAQVQRGATVIQAGARAAIAQLSGPISVEGAIQRMQDPRDAVGWAAKGSVLLTLGEYDAAVRAYLEAVRLAPTPDSFRGLLRALTPEGGTLESAAERTVEIAEELRLNATTLTMLGRLLLDLRHVGAAVDCLEAAYELDSEDSDICHELGRALKRNEESERAREVLGWGLQLEESADLLEEMARVCYFGLDDNDAAIEYFAKLIEVAPERAADVRLYQAAAYRLAGRHAEAIEAAERAVRENPRSAAQPKALGDALFAAGRIADALGAYEHANAVHLEFGRSFPAALYGKAECLEKLGKPDDAIAVLREILEIEPEHANAHNKLGTLYERRRDLDRAEECYNRALEIDSESSNSAYPRCNLGTVAIKRGRYVEAIEWLTRAAELEPTLYFAHNNLACALLELGREQEAIRIFERTVEIEPHNPLGYFNIACVHGRAGRQREALAWLERAIDEGYVNRDKLLAETDLDSIRGMSEFQSLILRVSS